jgi:hypothetical protein
MFIVWCVGSGLCDELITRSEGSYRVCVCVCVCVRVCVHDVETSATGRPWPDLGCCAIGTKTKVADTLFSRAELLKKSIRDRFPYTKTN